MYIIFIAAWILSPLVLIPFLIKKSKESSKLRSFIDELCRNGRISTAEYISLKAEKVEKQSSQPSKEASAPVFADSHEFSKIHGGDSAKAIEKSTDTVNDKNISEAAVQTKPAVSVAKPEANKNLYDMSFSVYEKASSNTQKPVFQDTESKKDNADKPVFSDKEKPVKPVKPAAEKSEYVKPVRTENKKNADSSEKKRAAAMSVLMMIGIIFVILAGLVFSTAVWATLGEVGRTCAIGFVSAVFFGISAFTGKKLKLERTSFAFYTLGTFFSAITLITAGFFGIMGTYFSVSGDGVCLLYAAALLIISLLSAKGRSIFDIHAASYISAFSGTFSIVLVLVQLSDNMGVFALLAAILTAVINIFVYVLDVKISPKWEKPLHIVTAVLNVIALLGGISAVFGDSPAFYAAAVIFVLRSIAAAVIGFRNHRIYKTGLAAVSSLVSGAFFTLVFMFKLSVSIEIFALSAAVFAVLFAFGLFTFNIEIPEGWNVPIKMSAFVLNAIGIISSFYALMRNFGEWNGVCFAIAGIYIISSFAAGIMAVSGHHRYKEAPSAFAAMFTGLAFSVMLVSELSASIAIAALCFTAILLVLVNAVYTLPSKIPEGWKTAVGISSAILGLISFFSTLFVLIDNFGNWDAACYTISVLYILQAVIVTALAYRGHSEYSNCRWAVISQLIGTFFSVFTLAELAESELSFMLYLTIFAVAYLNFVHTLGLKKPEEWESPLKVFSYLLGIFGVIFTAFQMSDYSEWTYHFYVTAAIYIAYSIGITAMAFFKHGEYTKLHWSVISQITGISFIIALLSRLAESEIHFMLNLTIFAVAYLNFVHTLGLKKSEEWESPLKVFSYLLGIFGVIFTACQMSNYSEWTYHFYVTAAIYIAYSIGITVMAFFKHGEYTKLHWSVISQITGISFIIALLSRLAESEIYFMLYLTIFAVAYLNFVHTLGLKKTEEWESPLKVFSYLLGIFGVIFTACQMFDYSEWTYHFYVTAAIYIAYSIGITVMAFFKYGEYSKLHWSVISQITGISFIIALLSRLAENEIHFMLYLTIFAVAYLNFVHTFGLKKPEKWESTLKVFSYLLGIFGVIFTACQMSKYSEWTYHFYVTAAIYIAYSIGITVMAFFKHSEYTKLHWSVISQITGISFIITLLSWLSESEIHFMLNLTIFAVLYLNFVNTLGLKKPEKWESPLKVFSYLLGICGIIFTVSKIFDYTGWTYHFCVTASIYIAYSIGITAMAFFKHGEYSKTRWAIASQLTGIAFSLFVIYKLTYSFELFILISAAFASLYSAAVYFAFMKMPEKWLKVTNVTDIIFNIAAALAAAVLAIENFGSWNNYCFLIAFLYIGYTAVRGIRNNNSFLKAAECVISSITAYNLCCFMESKNIAVSELIFIFVCMMFVISLIHHFAKPIRTLFSDIFLTAVLAVSALACAFENNIFGVLSFALLGLIMLIKSAESGKMSAVFKVLLPLPVTGMVFTFVYYNISDLFGTMAAVDTAVLAVIAAVIMLIRKKSDLTFYSFAFTSSVLIFFGTASDLAVMLVILLGASVMLTALFCRCKNNLPSLLTMAGTAAVFYSIAETASLHTDFNVSLLLAAIFAAASLAASRVFYGRKLLEREDDCFRLDTCCTGILLALPMVHSANERVTAFAVLSILAAFAANLARKENKGDANRVALTVGCGLFTAALIFRPFLIVSDALISRKITLAIICAFGFAFSKIWAKYPRLSENFSSAVYGISFVCLIIDALSNQTILNTLIVLGVSVLILLYSFVSKKKRWFAVSSISLTGLTLYMFRDFFTMIDWWVYLLIVGFILIAVSAANEYFVRKGREFKEKAGRFFEDWKW